MKKLGVFIPILLTIVLAFSMIPNVNATLNTYVVQLSDGWGLNVDTGEYGIGVTGSDLWWDEAIPPPDLRESCGARFAKVGVVDLNSVCDVSEYSFDLTTIEVQIPDMIGCVILIKTDIGNYAKIRIDAVGGSVQLTVTYQDDGSTDFCPHAVGGIYAPTEKLDILTPYIALVGLIGAVSSIFVIVKKRRT